MKKNIFIVITAVFTVIFFGEIHPQTGTLEATLSFQNIDGNFIPYQNGMPVPSFEKQNRTMINLAGTWKKERFTADHNLSLRERDVEGYAQLIAEAGGRYLRDFDDSQWEDMNIPGVENIMNDYPAVPEYYQDGIWYRYKFQVDNSLAGKFFKLIFYSVNYTADVWLNGEYLGYHEGGYTPFAFNATGNILPGETNVIAVRVDNIPWGSRKDIVPFYQCDWFNYAGIIHDVYIEVSENLSVARTDIVPLDLDGNISIKTVLLNNYDIPGDVTIKAEIYTAEMNESNIRSESASDLIFSAAPLTSVENSFQILSDAGVWTSSMNIPNPKLWTPSEPNLYVMKISLMQNKHVVDEFYTQFGLRTIKTVNDKVYFNDKVVFFTGAARHEDHPLYGRSMPKDIIYSDLEFIKSSNINFLRTGHYPNHPYTYLIADRLGLPIMEEIPVWWFDDEEPWLIQNEQRHIHEQMFREMVLKDFNRPSIILWSTSNECKEETNRVIFNEWIKNDLREKYNDGRLISQSSAGDKPGFADLTQAPLDVAGWTLYFGIFHGDPFQHLSDNYFYTGTVKFLVDAHTVFHNKPIIDTEFGYWSSEDGSSAQTQVKVFTNTFKAFKFFSPIFESGNYNPSGCLMASTWWCVFDWYSHGHPNGYQSMGLVTMDRQTTKPVYDALVAGYKPYFDLGGMILTDIQADESGKIPVKFELMDNYPNPFNPSTVISYSLPENSDVTLKIYDLLGREISTLVNEYQKAGIYRKTFSTLGDQLSSGIYFYKLSARSDTESRSSVKKMILIK